MTTAFEVWRSDGDAEPCRSPQARRAANGGEAFRCVRSSCRLFVPGGPRCASLVADDSDGLTLEEVGEMFGVTRERVRQVEEAALVKLRLRHRGDELHELAREGAAVAAG